MYDVTITNGNVQRIIHDHRGASNAQKLPEGSIIDAENSISSFTFKIYPNNAGYESLNANTTQVKVRNTKRTRDDFVGRVLQIKPKMDSNGAVYKTVVCEDRLGYLHDSIQPFAEMRHYVGDNTRTGLEEFVDVLLTNHNAQVETYKRIYRGTVTVKPFASSNDVTKGLNWESTFDAIREKLLNSFGGFIRLRETAGVLYLDYLESIGTTRSTKIEVGRNMRSISKEIDPSGIVTRLVPLGTKLVKNDGNGNEVESEERLTIAAINNGLDYIESELYAQQFGIKYGTVIFDDVTDASNLLRKGTEWLASNNGLAISYDVDALDLSLLGLDIDDFVLYDSYPVKNNLIGTNEVLKIIKKTTNVIEPHKSSFEMGAITKKLSDMIIDDLLNVDAVNGKNSYLHLRYSDNEDGSGMTEQPTSSTKYMGVHSSMSSEAPTDPASYKWTLIRGSDGKDGKDGAAGKNGIDGKDGTSVNILGTYETEVELIAAHPTGAVGDAYIVGGDLFVWTAEQNSWVNVGRIQGDPGRDGKDGSNGVDGKDGANGKDGADGKDGVGVERITPRYAVGTSNTAAPSTPTIAGWSIAAPSLAYGEYLWCSYYVQYTDGSSAWTEPFHARSADQITQAEAEPESPSVGTLWLDTSETPYALKRFDGESWVVMADYSDEFEEVYTYVNTTVTELSKTTEGLVASVAEETVSKNVYEEFTTLVKNILKMEADGTTMIFQTINEAIQDVGDTEASHYAELLTYIRFSEDGIEIGKQGNAITMRLDNDSLDFYNNGTRVAYMSDNTLYITDGRFTRSVRIGNYGFIPEANGSVSFTYLGGES